MLQKSLFGIFIASLLITQSYAKPNFPFPQDQTYRNNAIMPTNRDHSHVQDAYKVFLNNFYEESGNQARIKWDTPTQTVSEGIGYGMLIMVYMDNDSNNTQPKFDKLWQYYKNNLDSYGLMNWKISGFSGVVGTNSATDGDLDVAFALALASYQWGGSYKSDAQSLLGKIYSNDVQGTLLCGGDNYKDAYNPSYFVFAALDMFKTFDPSHNWGAVATSCYNLMKTAQNGTTGLIPDWCNSSGGPGGNGPNYSFDAARCPWRVAMSYCWYGDADAKTIANKINSWLKSNTGGDPTKIKDGYKLDGTPTDTFNIPAYIGPFTCAAMVDGTYQSWLDACYNRLAQFIDNSNYYNQCLQVMTMLLLTGNSLDLSTATPKTEFKIMTSVVPTGAGTITVSPSQTTYQSGTQVTVTAAPTGTNKFVNWSGDLAGTALSQTFNIIHDMSIQANFNAGSGDLVDDCEHTNDLTRLGGKWFTYNDASQNAKSSVTPLTSKTNLFTMSDGGANGSAKCAKITYTLDAGSYKYNPFCGMGFLLDKSSTDSISVPMNISAATGLTFFYKGDTCDVRIETANITDAGYYHTRVPKAADWTAVSVKWTSMIQATWAAKASFDLTKATKVAWQTPDYSVTGMKGSIAVDDIHLTGFTVPSGTKPISLKPARTLSFSIASDNAKAMTVRYSLPASGAVEIAMFDLSGKMLHQLFSGQRYAGYNVQNINLPGAMPRGTYLVQVKSESGAYSDKIAFVK